MDAPPGRTFVAVEAGQVLGTAKLHPNQAGPGGFCHPVHGYVGLLVMYRSLLN